MAKFNRKCILCGANYSFCGNCQGDSGKPSWYLIFDGERCNSVYEICTQYRDGKLNAKEAYKLLSELDLSNLEDFVEVTKNQIKEIIRLNEETVEAKESAKTEDKAERKNEAYRGNTNKRK